MEINKTPSPSEYLPITLGESEEAKLDDQENSVATTGANTGAAPAADTNAYYTKEEELMMDEQFQDQRNEQRRDDQNAQLNNWQLQNASFKA